MADISDGGGIYPATPVRWMAQSCATPLESDPRRMGPISEVFVGSGE